MTPRASGSTTPSTSGPGPRTSRESASAPSATDRRSAGCTTRSSRHPVALVAGETATPAQVEALRHQLGYDRPLPVQFVDYVARLARGDMGVSLFTPRPIVVDLAHRLPATIELTVVAMLVSVLVGIPLGVVSAP